MVKIPNATKTHQFQSVCKYILIAPIILQVPNISKELPVHALYCKDMEEVFDVDIVITWQNKEYHNECQLRYNFKKICQNVDDLSRVLANLSSVSIYWIPYFAHYFVISCKIFELSQKTSEARWFHDGCLSLWHHIEDKGGVWQPIYQVGPTRTSFT